MPSDCSRQHAGAELAADRDPFTNWPRATAEKAESARAVTFKVLRILMEKDKTF